MIGIRYTAVPCCTCLGCFFYFYANARGLLKESNKEIFINILPATKKISREKVRRLLSSNFNLWNCLRELFSNIDLTYNGGLFNPTGNVFVEDVRISNLFLEPVIYFMTYYEDANGSTMPLTSIVIEGVRHLGSLYEGLLEHKLFVAEEDTEVRVRKKRRQIYFGFRRWQNSFWKVHTCW